MQATGLLAEQDKNVRSKLILKLGLVAIDFIGKIEETNSKISRVDVLRA